MSIPPDASPVENRGNVVKMPTAASTAWKRRHGLKQFWLPIALLVAIFGFAAMMVTFVGISYLSGQHGFIPNLGSKP